MEKMSDDTTLSLKKMEFIQKIVSERSLDTVRGWTCTTKHALWLQWIAKKMN